MTTQTHHTRGDVEQFAAKAEQWLADAVPAKWKNNRGTLTGHEMDELRREWDFILWEGGYSGLSIPKEYGGRGLGLAEEIIFHVLAGSAQAPDGLARVGKSLVAPMLIKNGTEAQRSKYIPSIMNGTEVWCQGFSEPEAGSDMANIQMRARRVDGGYILNGVKTWTSFAQHARRCFVLAQTQPEARRYRNLSMFLVDMDQPGVSISNIKQISGAMHFAETRFDDVFVADEDRVGDDGDGWGVAMRVLGDERGGIETAARYVEIRSDVDALLSALGDNPRYADRLKDLDIRTELVRWQLAKIADLETTGDEAKLGRAASVLKLMWSELWQDVTRLGVTRTPVEEHKHWTYQYLEARAVTIYGGSSEIQRNILSERVLGLPR
ncbi:acyl-CoA dehydrogenase [Rhodococcus sp. Eu-32]|uniref:acyl-CoA dehydrogenase family protein n=1 Tax=Rhodococcus sp. Eu-32 TaxID=1017319 RepID=UPI000DF221E5|nr:acyl-CoA dehydrogenase family protein [Rhodococcus sp. Eu-32]RRQ25638.1 acyl-CoA dehydrogenase [Rhodococcus sp. Eu-32]